MKRKHQILTAVMALTTILLAGALAACTPAAPAAPTQDPNAIASAAVQTYEAGITASAAAIPTDTPVPSATPSPVLLDESTTVPQGPTATYYIAPEDKAEFVSQKPLDGQEVGMNTNFRVTWTVQNTGKTTWTTAYSIRYFSGANLGKVPVVYFPKDVPPGEQVKLTVDMVTPNYPSDLNTNWVLTNASGQNFYSVNFSVKVVKGPTITPTRTATSTPTPGPSPTKVIG